MFAWVLRQAAAWVPVMLALSTATARGQEAVPSTAKDGATTASLVSATPAPASDTMITPSPASREPVEHPTPFAAPADAAPEAAAAPIAKPVAAPRHVARTAESEARRDPEDGAERHAGPVDTTHTVLMYVPNRLLDLLDVFRLRARLGPGTALGVRATDWADLYLGSYTSVFAGLPGPRGGRKIPIPVGLETKSGVEAGPWDATLTGNFGPDYGPAEFGVSLHLILIGADAGIDPWEIVDFFAGFGNVDLRDDDF